MNRPDPEGVRAGTARDRGGSLNEYAPRDVGQMKSLFKASNGYTPFIEKAYSISVAHPEILPGFLSAEELGKDVALIEALRPIQSMVNELAKALQDTMVAANSDALGQCLEIYTAVKQYSDKVPGLASSQEELSVFFQRSPRKTAAPTA